VPRGNGESAQGEVGPADEERVPSAVSAPRGNELGEPLGPERELVVQEPVGPWTTQQARNFVAALGDRTREFSVLVRDRAGQFAQSFDTVLTDAGVSHRRTRLGNGH
jgi:hypothetical protein